MINETIDRDNLRVFLAVFIEDNELTIRNVAKRIGCSQHSLNRILAGETLPTDEMIKQCGIMMAIGFDKYSRLSKAEKEKISEKIGAVGGGTLGFGAITVAISSLGISGLSAVGITTGLSALGAIVGGGMIAGVTVAAAIPISFGVLGYSVIRGVKIIRDKRKGIDTKIDLYWEIMIDNEFKTKVREKIDLFSHINVLFEEDDELLQKLAK